MPRVVVAIVLEMEDHQPTIRPAEGRCRGVEYLAVRSQVGPEVEDWLGQGQLLAEGGHRSRLTSHLNREEAPLALGLAQPASAKVSADVLAAALADTRADD